MEANFLNHSIGQQVNSKGGPTMPQITYNDFRNTTVKVHLQQHKSTTILETQSQRCEFLKSFHKTATQQ